MLHYLALILLFPAATIAEAAKGSQPQDNQLELRLDTAFVHKTYLDGDFDYAIELLEDALRNGGPFSHADSVFIFKHLGVMYTATYETREKGKYFMVQLLNVEPTAKILDMYASDMIYMIFKNIQDEFHASTYNTAQPVEKKETRKHRSYSWLGWTAGAVAATGGILLTIHLLSEDEPSKKVYTSNE